MNTHTPTHTFTCIKHSDTHHSLHPPLGPWMKNYLQPKQAFFLTLKLCESQTKHWESYKQCYEKIECPHRFPWEYQCVCAPLFVSVCTCVSESIHVCLSTVLILPEEDQRHAGRKISSEHLKATLCHSVDLHRASPPFANHNFFFCNLHSLFSCKAEVRRTWKTLWMYEMMRAKRETHQSLEFFSGGAGLNGACEEGTARFFLQLPCGWCGEWK